MKGEGQHRPLPPTPPSGKRPRANRLQQLLRAWWQGKNLVFQFSAGFAGLLALFYALTLTPWYTAWFRIYLRATVATAHALLHLLGQATTVSGTVISSAACTVDVRRGCDGLEPVALFAAAVLAVPLVGVRGKLWGIAAGVASLLALNQVRIVSLYFIGAHWPGLFELMHVEVWQVVFILLGIVLWVCWVQWALRRARADLLLRRDVEGRA